MTEDEFYDKFYPLLIDAINYDDYEDLLNAGCDSGIEKAFIIKDIFNLCYTHEFPLWAFADFVSKAISKGKILKYFDYNKRELEELLSMLEQLTECVMSGEDE